MPFAEAWGATAVVVPVPPARTTEYELEVLTLVVTAVSEPLSAGPNWILPPSRLPLASVT
ncbi:hypothetical protein D3C72_604730 [compost metagenome]